MKITLDYESPAFRLHPFDILLQSSLMDEKSDIHKKQKFCCLPIKTQIQFNDTWNNKYLPSRTKYLQKFREIVGKVENSKQANEIIKQFPKIIYTNHPIFICDISGIAVFEHLKQKDICNMMLKKVYYVDDVFILWIDKFIKESCIIVDTEHRVDMYSIANRNFHHFLNGIFTAYFIIEKKNPLHDSDLYFNYIEMFNLVEETSKIRLENNLIKSAQIRDSWFSMIFNFGEYKIDHKNEASNLDIFSIIKPFCNT